MEGKEVSKHLIPAALAVADIAAAVVCALHRDWARAIYWTSAASITASTIYMKG